ncbi:MAG: hypothetical protein WD275_04855 [Rhodothermales bacterium]
MSSIDARGSVLLRFSSVTLALSLILFSGCRSGQPELEVRQHEVADRGADVMPFDLEKTNHVFQEMEDGGLQKVVVKDASDSEQIGRIRVHLQEEAARFRQGDFSDPAQIHGHDMPGLSDLQMGAERIDISYAELPDGAQVRYKTTDPDLIHAIHRWFEAQRSDHGRHAREH